MVEPRAVGMKRDSLSCCKGGLPWTPQVSLALALGMKSQEAGSLQCESHIRADGVRKRREGTWGQLLSWAALGLGRAHNSLPSGRGSFLIWTG